MKSDPATPPMRGKSLGVPLSTAATRALGGNADGRRGNAALVGAASRSAAAIGGAAVVVAPATAMLAKNLRRLTPERASFRAGRFSFMEFSP